MSELIYRGVKYNLQEEDTSRADRMLYYRGAAYNPAKQEVQPETAATLIYRGVEYQRPATNQLARIRKMQQKEIRLGMARYAYARR